MGIAKALLCYFLVLIFSGAQAMACGQPAENEDKNLFGFSFENSDQGLILKKKINRNDGKQLLDDTGFLGIQVGLSSMLDGKEEKLRNVRYSEQINFTKGRIDTYLAAIKPVSSPDAAQMQEKEKVIRMLNKLKELLASDPPANEIHDLWKKLEATNAKFVTISAKSRSGDSGAWSDEQLLNTYTLPSPKWYDASKPKLRCISVPYVSLDLDTYQDPSQRNKAGTRRSQGTGSGSGTAVGTD